MTAEERGSEKSNEVETDISRRDFIVVSVAAGLIAATSSASAAALPVVETDVMIKTPDGTCDAAFIHPTDGSHPGVLIWAVQSSVEYFLWFCFTNRARRSYDSPAPSGRWGCC